MNEKRELKRLKIQEEFLNRLISNPEVIKAVDPNTGSTALHEATKEKYVDIISRLIVLGCDVNASNKLGITPLHIACRTADAASDSSTEDLSSKIIKLLLINGADPNAKTKNMNTPLHEVSANDYIPGIELLVEHGSKTDAKTIDGDSPLHIASQGGCSRAVEFLIKIRPSLIDEQNKIGDTATHIACKEMNADITCQLIMLGADVGVRNKESKVAWDLVDNWSEGDKQQLIDASTARKQIDLREEESATLFGISVANYRAYIKTWHDVEDIRLLDELNQLRSQIKLAKEEKNYDEQFGELVSAEQDIPYMNRFRHSKDKDVSDDIERWIDFFGVHLEAQFQALAKAKQHNNGVDGAEAGETSAQRLRQSEDTRDAVKGAIKKLKEMRQALGSMKPDDLSSFLRSCDLSREKSRMYAEIMITRHKVQSLEHLEQLSRDEELEDKLSCMSDENDRKKVAFEIFKRTVQVGDIQIQDIAPLKSSGSGKQQSSPSFDNLYTGFFSLGAMRTDVVIKLADGRRDIQKESEILDLIGSSTTATVRKYGMSKRPLYIVLERFGQDLTSFLQPNSDFLITILKKFLVAIDYLHSKGICHLDLKPQNILVQTSNQGVEVKLCDFENAQITGGPFPGSSGNLRFTKEWASPEVVFHESNAGQLFASPAMDIFSAALVLGVLLDNSCQSDSTVLPKAKAQYGKALVDQLYLNSLFYFNGKGASPYKQHVLKMCRLVPSERYTITELLSELSRDSTTNVIRENEVLLREVEQMKKSGPMLQLQNGGAIATPPRATSVATDSLASDYDNDNDNDGDRVAPTPSPVRKRKLINKRFVQLTQRLGGGLNKKSKSILVDGLFFSGLDRQGIDVKVKLSQVEADIENEHNMLQTLNSFSGGRYFIQSFGAFSGYDRGILGFETDDLTNFYGLVMEKGNIDLEDYVQAQILNNNNFLLSIPSILAPLCDILEVLHKNSFVMMDFKPSNVVVLINSTTGNSQYKAIDVETMLRVNEPITNKTATTPKYISPEMACHLLSKRDSTKGESTTANSLTAQTSMDIFSLGLFVWECYNFNNGMKTLWEAHGVRDIFDTQSILKCAAALTDHSVEKALLATFPTDKYRDTRSWLADALKIEPHLRFSANNLKNNHSLLNKNMAPTMNIGEFLKKSDLDTAVEAINKNINERASELQRSIGNLKKEVQDGFSKVGDSLQQISARAAFGDDNCAAALKELSAGLQQQRQNSAFDAGEACKLLSPLDSALSDPLVAAINAAVSTPVAGASLRDDAELARKVDMLIDMVSNMQLQIDSVAGSVASLKRLTHDLSMNIKTMPHSFVIKPKPEIQSDSSLSTVNKISNFVNRKLVAPSTELFWSESVLVFVCPVTMKEVRCGPTGDGYHISIPTTLLKTIVPAFKWGLFFLKIALSTQGLGGVIPSIDLLNGFAGVDISSKVMLESNYLESMVRSIDLDKGVGGVDEFLSSLLEKDDSAAFDTVRKWLWEKEKSDCSLDSFEPKLSGLIKVMHDDASIWVSPEGAKQIRRRFVCDCLRGELYVGGDQLIHSS